MPLPDRFILGKETRYPSYRRLGWTLGPVCMGAENLSSPDPDFIPRTVQPVASRCTDYTIQALPISQYQQQSFRKTLLLKLQRTSVSFSWNVLSVIFVRTSHSCFIQYFPLQTLISLLTASRYSYLPGEVLNGTVVPPLSDVFPLHRNLPPLHLASVTPGVRLLVSPCPLQDRTYTKKKGRVVKRGWLLRINSTQSDISHRSCFYVCRVV